MKYRGGVTNTGTDAAQVMRLKTGVCQDYAHLMIAGLRAIGLPARYVSGYLRTWPPPGQEKRRGADQSHAWVASWLGPALGWVDLDPTNDLLVRDEHVTLGLGPGFWRCQPAARHYSRRRQAHAEGQCRSGAGADLKSRDASASRIQ